MRLSSDKGRYRTSKRVANDAAWCKSVFRGCFRSARPIPNSFRALDRSLGKGHTIVLDDPSRDPVPPSLDNWSRVMHPLLFRSPSVEQSGLVDALAQFRDEVAKRFEERATPINATRFFDTLNGMYDASEAVRGIFDVSTSPLPPHASAAQRGYTEQAAAGFNTALVHGAFSTSHTLPSYAWDLIRNR